MLRILLLPFIKKPPFRSSNTCNVVKTLQRLRILDVDVTVMKRKAVLCQRILLTASLMRESKTHSTDSRIGSTVRSLIKALDFAFPKDLRPRRNTHAFSVRPPSQLAH